MDFGIPSTVRFAPYLFLQRLGDNGNCIDCGHLVRVQLFLGLIIPVPGACNCSQSVDPVESGHKLFRPLATGDSKRLCGHTDTRTVASPVISDCDKRSLCALAIDDIDN